MIHSAAKKLNIVVLSNGLNKYFHQLHNFVFCLGLIERTRNLKLETLIKLFIGFQEVYEFKKGSVNNVRRYYGLNDETSTQGPHGTAQLLLSKTRREYSLYRLRNLRKDFEDLRPRPLEKFDIRSILTLCAENVFSEMRSGVTDVPLQLEFDRRFPRVVRESSSEDCTQPVYKVQSKNFTI